MEIAILTSSRADYGLYRPLLFKLRDEKGFKVRIIAFGTHLSGKHGRTVNDIRNDGFRIFREIRTLKKGDGPSTISRMVGLTHRKFADLWNDTRFDLIVCLGDRYEMHAAATSSIPFNIPIVHISGGDETLGAFDNYYRHSLTLASAYHFTNTEKSAARVRQLINSHKNVYVTGSLSIDNISQTALMPDELFRKKFGFDPAKPFILFTFHPETIAYKKNSEYAKTIEKFLAAQQRAVLVTMPNADTRGNMIRNAVHKAANRNSRIKLVESLGSEGYYTAMAKCRFVMGNSSSGIVEAASFGKWVINMGDRQKGREQGNNIINAPIQLSSLRKAVKIANEKPILDGHNIYGDGKSAQRMLSVLKKIR
jgi:GDP/UDP-N,N'-diacetylbacillosamine 2-epimerase (hydrolysing)